MSLFYGYQKVNDSVTTGGLLTTGGTMTGNINMGYHHILTSSDPTANAHLARKKYVDDKVSRAISSIGGGTSASAKLFLPKTGGTMKGNIIMGNNKITTTSNPTSVKDLTRKKYIDDQHSKKLSLTGGTMSGNIDLGNNKILTTSDPTGEKHSARKKYVDTEVSKKWSLSGGTMSGDIVMGSNNVKFETSYTPTFGVDATNKTYVDHHIDTNLKILKKDVGFSILKDNFSLKFHNLYFVEYDSVYDLLFQRNGGKVKELIDYGFGGNNFKQTTKSLQPSLCTESEKNNNKYHLKFNDNRMVSDININPISGKKDIINVFIV